VFFQLEAIVNEQTSIGGAALIYHKSALPCYLNVNNSEHNQICGQKVADCVFCGMRLVVPQQRSILSPGDEKACKGLQDIVCKLSGDAHSFIQEG
jgi:hypothetical protein